ncbi:hypothetical protein COCON_G00123530 [Conger conger]|uniref:Cation exchanger C521.04c n=1 Tax=Conger conger TaxID=82655 RepID=A0A9Q1DHF1_CONCO|nr:hypothetical protein COCON_G00123530 [Conger conger]
MSLPNVDMSKDSEYCRRRSTVDSIDPVWEPDPRAQRRGSMCDRLCVASMHPDIVCTPSPKTPHQISLFTPRYPGQRRHSLPSKGGVPGAEDVWEEATCKTTIRAENEVEAHKVANNYKFGFRKWKSHVTARPFEDRSDVVKELYSELNVVRSPEASLITCGNVVYVLLFGWWISLTYLLVSILMFITVLGVPYGKLCWRLSCYFLWPFGKAVDKTSAGGQYWGKFPNCKAIPEVEEVQESSPLLLPPPSPMPSSMSSAMPTPVDVPQEEPQLPRYWCRVSTYVWLLLGYPVLCLVHVLACFLSWMLVFTIPVSKMNARTLTSILLVGPEKIHVGEVKTTQGSEGRALLCCYHAFNWYYYKYTVNGINVFAVNLLPLVIVTLVIGYADKGDHYISSEAKFATAVCSIIPVSYYIGMGIASISAQSNFAVGAVVNATFGSITEMTFYITALLRGHRAGNSCFEEIVKSALTGTLLGCILFIPGICMIIGGLRHREQRFNSRSAGVSSALLFISVGGVFAPTLFSKVYGTLVCEDCTNSTGNANGTFVCKNCHYDQGENKHIQPLVNTISLLLPSAYIIGLIFTLKTHTYIYDIHISGCNAPGHDPVVHWSRWRALFILIVATLLMSACADLTTEHIQPILAYSTVSQYFIGVTVLAMVSEIPEIVNGIQFALQNNISLSLEVGSCIAVQVCMIQIPLLILFNAFYDVGFVLIFSDLHLWASIFSVILVNYIFMDGKSDYFQGTALVVVYLILLALYFFAPTPTGC